MVTELQKLWIWKEAQDLAQLVYEKINDFSFNMALKNQIDRSSQSVCDNIAEMYGAYYFKVKQNSLRIARKEAYETINHIEKMKRRKLCGYEFCEDVMKRYGILIAGINNYIKYVQSSEKEYNEKNNL
ncbi:four helix bundle protein [Candidatus Falkowbacteria bacterium]|jgi:four helix bundle protein|nr:four helix bundle protein [Candidatus Falkowbacteria bacterium]MBT7006969.1 four helix bundle protein [Candidatus Falkowbacteria bacterium]